MHWSFAAGMNKASYLPGIFVTAACKQRDVTKDRCA